MDLVRHDVVFEFSWHTHDVVKCQRAGYDDAFYIHIKFQKLREFILEPRKDAKLYAELS